MFKQTKRKQEQSAPIAISALLNKVGTTREEVHNLHSLIPFDVLSCNASLWQREPGQESDHLQRTIAEQLTAVNQGGAADLGPEFAHVKIKSG